MGLYRPISALTPPPNTCSLPLKAITAELLPHPTIIAIPGPISSGLGHVYCCDKIESVKKQKFVLKVIVVDSCTGATQGAV